MASLSALLERVIEPLGLRVERIARVPYLCRGDASSPYYVLSDVILVLKHGDGPHGYALAGAAQAEESSAALGASKKRQLAPEERCERLSYANVPPVLTVPLKRSE